MIAGIFHEGSGLGDQLFRYITTRTLAESKGYEFWMKGFTHFKGDGFLKLPSSLVTSMKGLKKRDDLNFAYYEPDFASMSMWNEKDTREGGIDIRSYDPEINFVQDNTFIDGSFEDDKYWRHNLNRIAHWLWVDSPYGTKHAEGTYFGIEQLSGPDDLCIIGFRGGEYSAIPELFLPKEYYDTAIHLMRLREPNMRFQVHTDDPVLAKQYFPAYEVIENTPISHSKHSNMALNWRSARYAKYAIIPNSAFFILPRILRHQDSDAFTIAPRYWARYNSKTWARPACYYPEFTYIHHESYSR